MLEINNLLELRIVCYAVNISGSLFSYSFIFISYKFFQQKMRNQKRSSYNQNNSNEIDNNFKGNCQLTSNYKTF